MGDSGLPAPEQARLLKMLHDFTSVSALLPLLHR